MNIKMEKFLFASHNKFSSSSYVATRKVCFLLGSGSIPDQ